MNKFGEKVPTLAWLVVAFAALPATVSARLMCDADGKNCFDFQCLPVEKFTLPKVELVDPPLKLMCMKTAPKQMAPGTSGRDEVLKVFSDACRNAGGTVADKRSTVACSLPDRLPSGPTKK